MSDLPIGIFDSGCGGLTVAREVMRLLPQEHIVYLGDTAHLPYGDKSPQVVTQYTYQNSHLLLKKKIKLLIIACHTASSHALRLIQQNFPIPVIGMIQPGLDLLIQATQNKKVAILGTASTIGSGVYQSLIQERDPTIEIHALSCPLFVPLVEEGFHDHPSAKLIAASYLTSLHEKEIDTALLACTHYPLLRSTIQEVLGSHVKLIEPAEQCALTAREILSQGQLLNQQTNAPHYEFYATDDPEKFGKFGKIFLGKEFFTKHQKFSEMPIEQK